MYFNTMESLLSTKSTIQHIVFFDLDGTLHQQDIFKYFLYYLLRNLILNIFLIIPLLPIIIIGFLFKKGTSRWPMSLLLWSITFGRSENKLKELQFLFVNWFRHRMIKFPIVQKKIDDYLTNGNYQVWLITGSPELLVKQIYHDATFFPKIHLIGSSIQRRYGGWILSIRCLGNEKVIQLERELGSPLKLHSGYSDSICDSPILVFCKNRWKVTYSGQLKKLD